MALSGSIKSNTGTNLNIRIDWNATQNVINNTSTITAKLYLEYKSLSMQELNDNVLHRNWLEIDGDRSEYIRPAINITGATYIRSTLLHSKVYTVSHGSNGAKSVNIAASMRLGGTYDGVDIGNVTASQIVSLDTIDRTAPNITLTVSSKTANSINITATSSAHCDIWQYRINNGTWVQVLADFGSVFNYKIDDLKPNTAYNIQVQARKTSNRVYGTSNTTNTSTLGATELNSVGTITADDDTVYISINRTIYDAIFTHTLIINAAGITISITGINGFVGTAVQTLSLTSNQRSQLLSAMSAVKSANANCELQTYSGATKVGSSSRQCIIQTSEANSAPIFNGFSHSDINSVTSSITGNSQIYIQHNSTLRIAAQTATARNGAVISCYEATIGSKTATSLTPTINLGNIDAVGYVTVTVTAIDSRGYSASRSAILTIIEYERVRITDYLLRRLNEVEETTEISISGTTSTLNVSGVNKNALLSLEYRYRKTSDTIWSDWTVVAPTSLTSTSFSFVSGEWLSFVADFSYYVQYRATDKLTYDIVEIILPQGRPIMQFRNKRLNINGELQQNNIGVMGYRGELSVNENLNDLTEQGLYVKAVAPSSNNLNYPPGVGAGTLEVLNLGSGIVQRYTDINSGILYTRTCVDYAWTAWKSTMGDIETVMNNTIVTVESIYHLPVVGKPDAVYIVKNENATYRWDDVNLKYYCVGRDYTELSEIKGGLA